MQNIILLHGALGSGTDLQPLSEKLKGANLNTHLLEFSGHGKSAFEKEFGVGQFSNELANYISKNSLQKAHVFGYSMGGFVALNLAATHPALLDKIITLGTKFKWTKEIVEKEASMLNPRTIMQKIPGYGATLESKHGNNWGDLLTKTSEVMKDIHDKAYLEANALSQIENRVLLGLGDRDKMVTYEETFNTYKLLPNAAMYMLPHTAHQIESVNGDLLCKVITEFLKDTD